VKSDSAGQSPEDPTVETTRTVTSEQSSEADGSSNTTVAAQSITLSLGQLIVGGVLSTLVIVWLQRWETLPQASSASHVRVNSDSAGQSPAAPTVETT
jgi:hypothetical protein